MVIQTRETRQKKFIEDEVKKLTAFFTAEELFSKIKGKDEKIGIATVYRFLKDKVSQGTLHSYYCDRKQIYSTNSHKHSHFMCTKCGKNSHIDIKEINFIKKNIKGKICHFQIDVYGICEGCSKKD